VAKLAQVLGPSNFIHLLHMGQAILNVVSPLRSQGNKFFCIVSKKELQPWIETREGSYFLRNED